MMLIKFLAILGLASFTGLANSSERGGEAECGFSPGKSEFLILASYSPLADKFLKSNLKKNRNSLSYSKYFEFKKISPNAGELTLNSRGINAFSAQQKKDGGDSINKVVVNCHCPKEGSCALYRSKEAGDAAYCAGNCRGDCDMRMEVIFGEPPSKLRI